MFSVLGKRVSCVITNKNLTIAKMTVAFYLINLQRL